MANRVKSMPRTIQPSVDSRRLHFVMKPAPSSLTYLRRQRTPFHTFKSSSSSSTKTQRPQPDANYTGYA